MAYGHREVECSERPQGVEEHALNYFIYIVRTRDNRLYIGHTNDLDRRVLEHKFRKFGAKYVKDHGASFELVYSERFTDRTSAMRREIQLKGWTRRKKEALIHSDLDLLQRL